MLVTRQSDGFLYCYISACANNPRISKEIKISSQTEVLWKIIKKTEMKKKTKTTAISYISFKSHLESVKRKSKRSYYSSKILEFKKTQKKYEALWEN